MMGVLLQFGWFGGHMQELDEWRVQPDDRIMTIEKSVDQLLMKIAEWVCARAVHIPDVVERVRKNVDAIVLVFTRSNRF